MHLFRTRTTVVRNSLLLTRCCMTTRKAMHAAKLTRVRLGQHMRLAFLQVDQTKLLQSGGQYSGRVAREFGFMEYQVVRNLLTTVGEYANLTHTWS